jgi:nucleotide-binding universal stress UspA family protein
MRKVAEQVRRIVVGLDALEPGRAAIEVATRLAASLRAEMLGLFVESPDLIELASLPFGALVELSGSVRSVDRGRIERALRAAATLALRELEKAAEHARLAATLRITRGRLFGELRSAAAERDPVVVAGAGGRSGKRPGPVVVLLEDPVGVTGLLELASSATQEGESALVLVPESAEAPAFEKALSWAERRWRTSVRRLADLEPRELGKAVEEERAELLLASKKERADDEAWLAELRSVVGCPLVLASRTGSDQQ